MMIKKFAAVVLLAAFVPLTGYAAETENAATLPRNDEPSPAQGKSFFEGIWVGEWHAFKNLNLTQDVTLKIRRGDREGVFFVEYSWGPPPAAETGFPPAGSVKTTGREDGDRFIFKWKTKGGNDVEFTLKKIEDNKVAARKEASGSIGSRKRPYLETYLHRQ
jgi:hypothetical protein